MNKKTTYLFEMHCCVNSPGQKSSFPSQYTFIFAGPLLPNRFLSCEPPLFLNLLTADYCDRSRLKAANVLVVLVVLLHRSLLSFGFMEALDSKGILNALKKGIKSVMESVA